MLKNFLLVSLVLLTTKAANYNGECFYESDLYGFDVGRFDKETQSDARLLYRRQLVEENTRPDALKVCFANGEIKSIQLRIKTGNNQDWLSVIGDQDFYKFNDCPVFTAPDEDLVATFISIGYVPRKGVNYVSIVFAPDFENEDPDKEVSIAVGRILKDMEFVNSAFSQQFAFIGFHGVNSGLGLPINQLGVIKFTCAKEKIDKNNNSIKKDGITINGGGEFEIDLAESLKEEAAERERLENEKRKKELAEVQAALDENVEFQNNLNGNVTPKGDESDDSTEEDLTLVIGILLVLIVVAIMAITAFVVLYCRNGQKINMNANHANDQDDQEHMPQQELPPNHQQMIAQDESQRVALNRQRRQQQAANGGVNADGMGNAVVEPRPQNRFDGIRERVERIQQHLPQRSDRAPQQINYPQQQQERAPRGERGQPGDRQRQPRNLVQQDLLIVPNNQPRQQDRPVSAASAGLQPQDRE